MVQTSPLEIRLLLYSGQLREHALLLSADPTYARAHFVRERAIPSAEHRGLQEVMRARCAGGTLVRARQVGFDRILRLEFEGDQGRHTLVAELMGKHSNLILLDEAGKVLAAAKTVPKGKSVRPIVPGWRYEPPPFPPRPSLLTSDAPIEECEGVSPVLRRWLEAGGSRADLRSMAESGRFEPHLCSGSGAYPISLAILGLPCTPSSTLSLGLEEHFGRLEHTDRLERRRSSLIGQLDRVIEARDTAIGQLEQALEAAKNAPVGQLKGELILAYGFAQPGVSVIQAMDYDGNPISIKVDPELTPAQNAQKYFSKAKGAKERRAQVEESLARLSAERREVLSVRELTERAKSEPEIDEAMSLARERRWLTKAASPKLKEDRPFEGHKVRELVGPGGYTVLYGENATSNDYITQRVARPDDWWLHVRGQVSAHVVVLTGRQPLRVPRETLLFAAQIAVRNSPMKHSTHVDVDYTLRKHVRKPRGSAPGFVTYTHEKTLTI